MKKRDYVSPEETEEQLTTMALIWDRIKNNIVVQVFVRLVLLIVNPFTIIGGLSVSITAWYFFKYCDRDSINVWEIRYYVGIFLCTVVFCMFGVLRIYNAIVVNSRFLHEFHKNLQKYQLELKKSSEGMNKHSEKLNDTFKLLDRSMRGLGDIIQMMKK